MIINHSTTITLLCLMSIIFELINHNIPDKNLQIKENYTGDINMDMIKGVFEAWGIDKDEIVDIRFIVRHSEGTTFIGDDDSIKINDNDVINVIVFCNNIDIKTKLIKIFFKNNIIISDDKECKDSKSDTSSDYDSDKDSVHSDNDFTDEDINSINTQSIKLFENPNFIQLVKIYYTEPDLFKQFSAYVQNGTVVSEFFKNDDDISDDKMKEYKEIANNIVLLGTGIDDDIILNRVIKFRGHMNLTLRSLLTE